MRILVFFYLLVLFASPQSLQAQNLVKSYSLVVLNDSYSNFEDLKGVSKPVEQIHSSLGKNFGFESEIIRNSGMQEFLTKLRVYSKQEFGATDQMLVYITGHVYHDSIFNMQYLAFSDSSPENIGTMIPLTELLVMVGNIACKHILLVLDDGPIWNFDKTIEKTAYLNISTLDGYEHDDIGNRLIYKTRKYVYLNSDDDREQFHRSIETFLSSSEREETVAGIKDFIRHLNKSNLGQQIYLGPFLTDEPAGEFLFQYR